MTEFDVSAAQIDEFAVNGFVIFRGAIARDRVVRVRETLARVVRTAAGRIGISAAMQPSVDSTIDTLLPEIYRVNPRAGGFVFDTVGSHAALYALYHSPPILTAAARLLGVDELEIVEHRPNLILQVPGERRRINGWHQESPYMSDFFSPEKSLFVWIPMADSTAGNGAVWVVPGSHADGELPHQTNAFGQHLDRDWDENGEAFLRKSQFAVERAIQVEGAVGDMVVLHFNLVHKRGLNSGPATRLNGILRLGAYTGRNYLPKYDIALA